MTENDEEEDEFDPFTEGEFDLQLDELELDLLQVGEIDTAGLQLLILLKKEAQRSGKRLSIVAHSQAVRAVIDFCNLAAELGDPLVIPAAETA